MFIQPANLQKENAMKAMNVAKRFGAKVTGAAVMASALVSTNAYAGAIADAITTATTDFKSDLTSTGGIAVGIAVIGIGFVAGIRLLKRAI